MADYENREVVGVIESVVRGQTQNGRDYANVRINGMEYNVWEPFLMSQAEMYQQEQTPVRAPARAKIDNGRVSKYWTLTNLEPVDGGQLPLGGSQDPTQMAAASVMRHIDSTKLSQSLPRAGRDMVSLRLRLVELSIEAHRGIAESTTDTGAIVAFATGLEEYVLGEDVKKA